MSDEISEEQKNLVRKIYDFLSQPPPVSIDQSMEFVNNTVQLGLSNPEFIEAIRGNAAQIAPHLNAAGRFLVGGAKGLAQISEWVADKGYKIFIKPQINSLTEETFEEFEPIIKDSGFSGFDPDTIELTAHYISGVVEQLYGIDTTKLVLEQKQRVLAAMSPKEVQAMEERLKIARQNLYDQYPDLQEVHANFQLAIEEIKEKAAKEKSKWEPEQKKLETEIQKEKGEKPEEPKIEDESSFINEEGKTSVAFHSEDSGPTDPESEPSIYPELSDGVQAPDILLGETFSKATTVANNPETIEKEQVASIEQKSGFDLA